VEAERYCDNLIIPLEHVTFEMNMPIYDLKFVGDGLYSRSRRRVEYGEGGLFSPLRWVL